jgi:hypothetical protein
MHVHNLLFSTLPVATLAQYSAFKPLMKLRGTAPYFVILLSPLPDNFTCQGELVLALNCLIILSRDIKHHFIVCVTQPPPPPPPPPLDILVHFTSGSSISCNFFVSSVEVWIFSVITQYSSSALTNPMEFVHDIGWCSSMNKKNTNKVFECKGCCRNNFIWSFPLHSNMFNIYKDLKQKYSLHWTSIT